MSKKHPTTLLGTKYGRLEVVGPEKPRKGKLFVLCRCDCGNFKEAWTGNLRHGRTQSCGCLQKQRIRESNTERCTHGHTGKEGPTRAYRCWTAIHKRCTNQNGSHYARYGGRGIRVCERWSSFENFLADMGEPPHGKSIERIDNDGDYCKENCQWATATEQARNRHNNRLLAFRGETKCMAAWAAEFGIRIDTLWQRLKRGWSIERALTRPISGVK